MPCPAVADKSLVRAMNSLAIQMTSGASAVFWSSTVPGLIAEECRSESEQFLIRCSSHPSSPAKHIGVAGIVRWTTETIVEAGERQRPT